MVHEIKQDIIITTSIEQETIILIVQTLSGKVEGLKMEGAYVFRGIPYASSAGDREDLNRRPLRFRGKALNDATDSALSHLRIRLRRGSCRNWRSPRIA